MTVFYFLSIVLVVSLCIQAIALVFRLSYELPPCTEREVTQRERTKKTVLILIGVAVSVYTVATAIALFGGEHVH